MALFGGMLLQVKPNVYNRKYVGVNAQQIHFVQHDGTAKPT